MDTSVPALGTSEYTNYLVNKGKTLGLNLEQFRQPSSNNTAPIADASKIGTQINIPTQTQTPTVAPELNRVGTSPIPRTGLEQARESLLQSVPEEKRAQIQSMLDVSTNLQTEKGAELEGEFEQLSKERLDLAQRRADRQREGLKLADDTGLATLEAELESVRGEADVLAARRNSAIQEMSRRGGMSPEGKQQSLNAIEKDFNLQQANLAIRELASVGKINAATKLIERKLDIKYGDIEAETELVKAQIEAILPLLSREDAKVAETRLLLNEEVKNTIADARAKDKELEETKLQIYLNAVQQGATPAVLSNIMSTDNLSDLLRVGGDYTQTTAEKLKEQEIKASISNIYSQINERKVKAINDTKAKAQLDRSLIKADTILSNVNKALKNVGASSTGFGSILKSVPGTSAYNLDKTVTTIKANIGFEELQAMRAASPTGGALGQVAVQELEALQSVIGSLDIGQTPAQLTENLGAVKTHYTNWLNAVGYEVAPDGTIIEVTAE